MFKLFLKSQYIKRVNLPSSGSSLLKYIWFSLTPKHIALFFTNTVLDPRLAISRVPRWKNSDRRGIYDLWIFLKVLGSSQGSDASGSSNLDGFSEKGYNGGMMGECTFMSTSPVSMSIKGWKIPGANLIRGASTG